jgi:hypothetical protein
MIEISDLPDRRDTVHIHQSTSPDGNFVSVSGSSRPTVPPPGAARHLRPTRRSSML